MEYRFEKSSFDKNELIVGSIFLYNIIGTLFQYLLCQIQINRAAVYKRNVYKMSFRIELEFN